MKPENKNEYLLLFRGNDWSDGLSPDQCQEVMGKWMGWFERLTAQGKLKGGQPLRTEGKLISGKGGRTITDGPFAESKEAIGGYFLLQVDDMEEAVQIAQMCPGLDYGAQVEVRPIAEMCPLMQQAQELAAAEKRELVTA